MAGIVFGCIVPHPPLLVPEVGGGRESEISATTEAMEKLTERLGAKRPETVVVISPHGEAQYSAMGVVTAPRLRGTMRNWGARGVDHDFANDLPLVEGLKEEAQAANIPLTSIGERDYMLDHGVMVPIYFLVKGMGQAALVPLTLSFLPLATHFAFGQAIRRAAERAGRSVALVASGDLSHRLLPSTPAGYDPMGQVFDRQLTEAVARLDSEAILGMDADLIERAGECGLRSVVILLGALEGLKVTPEVLSYEGPFGVGYLVASFEIQGPSANPARAGGRGRGEKRARSGKKGGQERGQMHPLTRLAKDTVESYVREGKIPRPPAEPTPEMRERAGVFVSIKKRGELRGCIGTFEPSEPSVGQEVITNAISSATRDPRFMAVTPEELSELTYSVDVLTRPEPVDSVSRLDARRYGVIVECGGRRGLLLPDLEGVETPEQQIGICRLKAGIRPDEPVKLYRFQVRRYT